LLRAGSVVGGALFFLALILMLWSFITMKSQRHGEFEQESPV
jgi:hypothetical protein